MDVDILFLKRKRANISQRTLAKRLGIATWSVIDIEKGRVEVTEAYLERMAEAIDERALDVLEMSGLGGADVGMQ